VCRQNNTETTLDTNVLVATPFARLGFVMNATGTSVTFYSADAAVGSITTNIPTAPTRAFSFMPGSIVKSLGTTSRSLYVDAYSYALPCAR
jgi:hypothetical protein